MKPPPRKTSETPRNRMIRERVHDTYKVRGKLKGPSRCPQCGAVYEKGRWSWRRGFDAPAEAVLCSACHRINDNYPAGELTLKGRFVRQHIQEITGLARNIAREERKEHPMNRIIDIRDIDGDVLITTTDVHSPARIAKAIRDAWEGDLDIHFDEEGYFTSIVWTRDL